MPKSNSPTSRAFRRFLRNKPAVIGLSFILVSAIVAVLGYQITPDSTPDANDQVLQITNKKPGFKVTMLKNAKNKKVETRSFFGKMFSGQDNPYELIPVHEYRFENDSIFYKEYTGENSGEWKSLNVADVVFPVSTKYPFVVSGDSITFTTIDGKKQTAGIDELKQKIEKENIGIRNYHFGTDQSGRDILSKLIIGVRISLSIGVVAVVISLLIGVILGALAGYFYSSPPKIKLFNLFAFATGFWGAFFAIVFIVLGIRADNPFSILLATLVMIISLVIATAFHLIAKYGIKFRFKLPVDDVIMWLVNVTWSIPTLLLVIAIQLALGRGFWQVYVAVGLTIWVDVARLIRGQVMGLRQMLYIEATRGLGYGHVRTIAFHILPNLLGPLMVVTAANFASAILLEAGLSFLGIGVQPPMPSWGGMLSSDWGYIISDNVFRAIIPGVAIMLMVLAFNMVGNGLRDALDVRTSLGSEP